MPVPFFDHAPVEEFCEEPLVSARVEWRALHPVACGGKPSGRAWRRPVADLGDDLCTQGAKLAAPRHQPMLEVRAAVRVEPFEEVA